MCVAKSCLVGQNPITVAYGVPELLKKVAQGKGGGGGGGGGGFKLHKGLIPNLKTIKTFIFCLSQKKSLK